MDTLAELISWNYFIYVWWWRDVFLGVKW